MKPAMYKGQTRVETVPGAIDGQQSIPSQIVGHHPVELGTERELVKTIFHFHLPIFTQLFPLFLLIDTQEINYYLITND